MTGVNSHDPQTVRRALKSGSGLKNSASVREFSTIDSFFGGDEFFPETDPSFHPRMHPADDQEFLRKIADLVKSTKQTIVVRGAAKKFSFEAMFADAEKGLAELKGITQTEKFSNLSADVQKLIQSDVEKIDGALNCIEVVVQGQKKVLVLGRKDFKPENLETTLKIVAETVLTSGGKMPEIAPML